MKDHHIFPGATLWECLMVISLIGLVYGGAIHISWAWHHALLYAQAHVVCMMCNYARQCALCSLTHQTVHFDQHKNVCRYDQIEESLAPGVAFGTSSVVYGPPSSPTKIVEKPISFVGSKMVCYPTGIMQAGTMYFTDRYKRTTYAVSNAVSSVSYMHIYRLNGSTWDLIY